MSEAIHLLLKEPGDDQTHSGFRVRRLGWAAAGALVLTLMALSAVLYIHPSKARSATSLSLMSSTGMVQNTRAFQKSNPKLNLPLTPAPATKPHAITSHHPLRPHAIPTSTLKYPTPTLATPPSDGMDAYPRLTHSSTDAQAQEKEQEKYLHPWISWMPKSWVWGTAMMMFLGLGLKAWLNPQSRPAWAMLVTERRPEKVESQAELFLDELEKQSKADAEVNRRSKVRGLQDRLLGLETKASTLQADLDKLCNETFADLEFLSIEEEAEEAEEEGDEELQPFPLNFNFKEIDAASFRALGRDHPEAFDELIVLAEQKGRWVDYQRNSHNIALVRNQTLDEIAKVKRQIEVTLSAPYTEFITEEEGEEGIDEQAPAMPRKVSATKPNAVSIVLMAGFESFNVGLYKDVAKEIQELNPNIQVHVFSDRDISDPEKKPMVENALANADAFFGSLLFDYDEVEWLKERIHSIPVRLVFESSLELMSETQLGGFNMKPSPDGKKAGPPPVVKKVLSLFGSQKEEDKLVGYLSFLKVGPKLLKFIPGKKARDLRNWLTIYSYWNQGGKANVSSMFLILAKEYLTTPEQLTSTDIKPVQEVPPLGTYHPCLWDCRDPSFDCGCTSHPGILEDPADYLAWYRTHAKERGIPADAPVVAILLYRKHVITRQAYLPAMIRKFEEVGILPLPIFINGVEAHTVVRDMLTTTYEQEQRKKGIKQIDTLRSNAVKVEAVVSTIGFPLVGGPAGSMEGGRQQEVSKAILTAKNIPYVVSAPLLIQDIDSWKRDGIGGLQSVVLYSLPELDGAIDAVPLGGLDGDDIILDPERASKLANRLQGWMKLRRKGPGDRTIAVCLYGFPPNVGATGTAALLNVPRSLEHLLKTLRDNGYDVGSSDVNFEGEAIIEALKALEDPRNVFGGGAHSRQAIAAAEACGATINARVVTARELKTWLGEKLTAKMEAQWGALDSYHGIMTSARPNPGLVITGLQFGNVWVGVQPLLGLEGDPMRLLFERDLTPHPQYAAFYKWLNASNTPEPSGRGESSTTARPAYLKSQPLNLTGLGADACIHFGMHGTVEWLPGASLGNTEDSWSDVLVGNMPNIYIYAANNPSESIVAKRRGYATVVSHNVPPYGRAGLYKELANLKELIAEYRENPTGNASLRPVIADTLTTTGLGSDCPFKQVEDESGQLVAYELTAEEAEDPSIETEFDAYMGHLNTYLLELEQRLFSEGLHNLGQVPSSAQMESYLNAFFGDRVPPEALQLVADADYTKGLATVKQELAREWAKLGVDGTTAMPDLEEALSIRQLLTQTTDEIANVVRGLNAEFIPPAPGGDLIRDGSGVLPTGRNIHALDPYRMPSQAAWERGRLAAQKIIQQHQEANNGEYPETVAVMLWGLDAIKTKGESLAIALELIGARPVKEGTGRIVRFELVPLEELGRPRVDVVCSLSGIFRDSFANVIDLLDDCIRTAGTNDESPLMNYIKKHTQELKASEATENPSARIFSNPSGDYGSMVNERVGTGGWDQEEELGETWASRNAFSYGRGAEKGVARPKALRQLLQSTDRIVQEIDSVEYGLTDIQEYYANTGALKNAADNERRRSGKKLINGGKGVGVSIVEAYSKTVDPRQLDDVLRMEYRSKLLNPKWAQAMANQGSGGAYEISQRMTALIGWGGTTGFKDGFVYDQAADTYVFDEDMAAKLKDANPQAFGNVLRRFLEAHGRGMWHPDPEVINKLKEMYTDLDDVLEGVER